MKSANTYERARDTSGVWKMLTRPRKQQDEQTRPRTQQDEHLEDTWPEMLKKENHQIADPIEQQQPESRILYVIF